jgi:hypothetical protein
MNILDHISVSLETFFWLKILKFFDAGPNLGSGIRNLFVPGSGMEKFGSRINIPNPQHWFCIGDEAILTVFSSTSFSILIYTHGAHWAIILLIDQASSLSDPIRDPVPF